MIRYDPGSFSRIATSTHIVEVQLQEYAASEWRPDDQLALDKRDVSATVRVRRIWKGELAVPPNTVVPIQFTQYAYRNVIRFALPGPWSRHTLIPGAGYFLFSIGSTIDVLEEPQLFFVETAEAAATDVELADRSGCPPTRLGVLLDETGAELPRFGALFAEYVASRIPEMFFDYPGDYHRLFQMMESAAASFQVRWIWLRETIGWISSMDPAPPLFLARTVFGCLRIAAVAGNDMRQAILAVYLPNLLGLSGGLTPKRASEVFQGLASTRQQSRDLLADPGLPNRGLLLEWLERP
jgi:hypothetical protein